MVVGSLLWVTRPASCPEATEIFATQKAKVKCTTCLPTAWLVRVREGILHRIRDLRENQTLKD